MITQVLRRTDRRGFSFNDARTENINGPLRRGASEILLEDDLPKEPSRLERRLVLPIKNAGTNDKVRKALFVVQGRTDAGKHLMVCALRNIGQRTVRLLVTVAAIFGNRLWRLDVSQAYLKSTDHITRDIYIRPKDRLKLNSNQLLPLPKLSMVYPTVETTGMRPRLHT